MSIAQNLDRPSTARDLLATLVLTCRLFGRYWPHLMALAATGVILRSLLLSAAISAGLRNPLAGMVVLSFVVLAKLVVIVLMFSVLRPDLSALRRWHGVPATGDDGAQAAEHEPSVGAIVAIAILPFFAYYAAWGFLGDTVREYSRLALANAPLGESAHVLDLLRSQWLVASIAACWIIRWAIKQMRARSTAIVWPLLIVACDATWVFIGLFALSTWQEELFTWIGSGGFFKSLPALDGLQSGLTSPAWAADGFVPVEFRPDGLPEHLRGLFFYTLLPLVWLVMAAIIYGYELSPKPVASEDEVEARPGRYRSWLVDFIAHFLQGYRSRYAPVLRCLRMVLGAGLGSLIAVIVGYRLIGWGGAWLWVAAKHIIGPHALADWQLIAEPIGLFIGSLADLDGGVLLDPLRICLLAAVVERAVAAQTVDE